MARRLLRASKLRMPVHSVRPSLSRCAHPYAVGSLFSSQCPLGCAMFSGASFSSLPGEERQELLGATDGGDSRGTDFLGPEAPEDAEGLHPGSARAGDVHQRVTDEG